MNDWVKQQVTQSFWQDKDSCSTKRAYQNILCHQKTVWKFKWTWVICERLLLGFFARIYFLPRHRWASRQPGWFSSYNPSYLHYEALALTTMACCHSFGVDFCISLGEYHHKYGFEDGKWQILFYKLREAFAVQYVQQSINTTESPFML